MSTPTVSSRDYLEALYGKCTSGQIVFIESCRDTVSGYFNVNRLDLAAQHIDRAPLNLFIKVNVMDHTATLARSRSAIGGTAEVKAIVSFHLDVDAGKNDKYLTREKMLEAIGKMPLEPSAIIETNGDTGGFHAYWMLEQPHYIESQEDRQRCQDISNRWLAELREFAKPGTIDGTANIDRILRPVGSLRPSGNRVRALVWNPDKRYAVNDFLQPEIAKPDQTFEPRHDGESIVEKYLDAVGENDPAALLQRYAGYTHVRDRFYIRPGSESGSPTGEVFQQTDGSWGFTFKSGACDPFTSTNKKGTNGKWYSAAQIYVMLCHGNDWKAAARHCYDFFRPKEDYSHINQMTANGAADPQSETDNSDSESQPAAKAPPKPPEPATSPAQTYLVSWLRRVDEGDLPQLIQQRGVLEGIEIGPGMITVAGAPPGAGKTALVMQIMFDALELDPSLRAVVANAETTFDGLIRREITRKTWLPQIGCVDSARIRFGPMYDHELERVNTAASDLKQRLERVSVLNEPCSVVQLARLRDEAPGLLIVDYIQKFAPGDKDARAGVNEVMAVLRMLAKCGWAVVGLSATKRDTNGKHSPKELSLSSFRESGEIEYNADSAYVLQDNGPLEKDYLRHVTLGHVKNRHGPMVNKELRFDMPRMQFTALEPEPMGYSEFGEVVGAGNPYDGELN